MVFSLPLLSMRNLWLCVWLVFFVMWLFLLSGSFTIFCVSFSIFSVIIMCVGIISATFFVLGICGVSSLYGLIVLLWFWKTFKYYVFSDPPVPSSQRPQLHMCWAVWTYPQLTDALSVDLCVYLGGPSFWALFWAVFTAMCTYTTHVLISAQLNILEGPCAPHRGSKHPCSVVLWRVNSCCPPLPGCLALSPLFQVVHWSPSFCVSFWDAGIWGSHGAHLPVFQSLRN